MEKSRFPQVEKRAALSRVVQLLVFLSLVGSVWAAPENDFLFKGPAGPDLSYRAIDLDRVSGIDASLPSDVSLEAELMDLLERQAPLLKLLKIRIKDEKKLVQKVLDLNKKYPFINLKSLKKMERRLNLEAWTNLATGLRGIRLDKLDQKSLASLNQALEDYGKLKELAKADKDLGKAGKYGYFRGAIKESLAKAEPSPEQRKVILREAREEYFQAFQNLSANPDPSGAVDRDDAREKVLVLDEAFGGILPLQAPPGKYVYMTSDIGMRIHPIKKKQLGHKGIDLAGQGCTGWKVQAIGPGRVTKCGWESGYGYVVNLVHEMSGEKLYTRCAHLKKTGRAKAGSVVEKGTVIGYCNNSGASKGSHLHFEVRKNGSFGTALDPKPFLPKVKAKGE